MLEIASDDFLMDGNIETKIDDILDLLANSVFKLLDLASSYW